MNQNLVTNQNGLVDKLRIRANESKVFNVLCHGKWLGSYDYHDDAARDLSREESK